MRLCSCFRFISHLAVISLDSKATHNNIWSTTTTPHHSLYPPSTHHHLPLPKEGKRGETSKTCSTWDAHLAIKNIQSYLVAIWGMLTGGAPPEPNVNKDEFNEAVLKEFQEREMFDTWVATWFRWEGLTAVFDAVRVVVLVTILRKAWAQWLILFDSREYFGFCTKLTHCPLTKTSCSLGFTNINTT